MQNEQIIIYQTEDGNSAVNVTLSEDTVWLTQLQMQSLFGQTKQNISLHINNIFKEGELAKKSTVKQSLTVQKEGMRDVKRNIEYYSLDIIISVGYRTNLKEEPNFGSGQTEFLKSTSSRGMQSMNKS